MSLINLQFQFGQAGYLLEDYTLWLGEPAPHKYICLSGKGRHLAYFATLAEAKVWLKDALEPIPISSYR
jgi:hypothetical protein